MAKFVYIYHGGTMPKTEEEGAQQMAAWDAWFESMGKAVVVPGAPVGASMTVTGEGVTEGGGANPTSGYTVVEATDMDAAVEMAKSCPILKHGSVEVAAEIEM